MAVGRIIQAGSTYLSIYIIIYPSIYLVYMYLVELCFTLVSFE